MDELPFGVYVELEGDENNIDKVADDLELHTTNRITVTYWDLFEDYKKTHDLQDKENIVFPQDYKVKIMELDLPKQ